MGVQAQITLSSIPEPCSRHGSSLDVETVSDGNTGILQNGSCSNGPPSAPNQTLNWRTPLKQGRAEIWRSENVRSENFLCLDLEIRLFSLQFSRPGISPANPFRGTCERETLKKEGVFSSLPNLAFVLK